MKCCCFFNNDFFLGEENWKTHIMLLFVYFVSGDLTQQSGHHRYIIISAKKENVYFFGLLRSVSFSWIGILWCDWEHSGSLFRIKVRRKRRGCDWSWLNGGEGKRVHSLGSRESESCAQALFTCRTAWGCLMSTLSQMRMMVLQSVEQKPKEVSSLSCKMHESKAIIIFAFWPFAMNALQCVQTLWEKSLNLQSRLKRYFLLNSNPWEKKMGLNTINFFCSVFRFCNDSDSMIFPSMTGPKEY